MTRRAKPIRPSSETFPAVDWSEYEDGRRYAFVPGVHFDADGTPPPGAGTDWKPPIEQLRNRAHAYAARKGLRAITSRTMHNGQEVLTVRLVEREQPRRPPRAEAID